MKRFSYKEITDKAEAEIKASMVARAAADDTQTRDMYWHWAYGVLIYWKDLTMGWQKDGDYERLRALTDIRKKEAA